MKTIPTSPARRAFTLTELLAVVAVIGVLAGILIPVVSHVRLSAARAVTTSNLRTLHQAILLYASDHKTRLPGPCGVGILFQAHIPSQPADTAHLGAFVAPYLATAPSDSNQWVTLPALKCPALSDEAQSNPLVANFVKLDDAVTSDDNIFGTSVATMSAAAAAATDPSKKMPKLMGEVTVPASRKAIVCTADQLSWVGVYNVSLPPGPVFDGRRLYLFLDGRVALSANGRSGR